MQVCNKHFFAFLFGVTAAVFCAAQSMPSVSSPTIGSGFYRPGTSIGSTYTGQSAEGSNEEASADSSDAQSAQENSSGGEVLLTLTASDIQHLSSSGLLDQLEALLGADGSSPVTGAELSSMYSSSSNRTNRRLQQVLSQIEELKKTLDQEEALAAETEGEEAEPKLSVQTMPVLKVAATNSSLGTKQSHLIRFTVNGYDILKTCRTVYISDVQNDGTFLVTGDRKYLSDGKTRSETFHMLFTTTGAPGGLQNYTAAAAVTQDYLNEYSFLYQLAQRDNLQASRTGNLVTMRTTDPDWKLELLIDLGEEQ